MPELALLALSYVSYAYAGSSSGAFAFSYDTDSGSLTQVGSVQGINCAKSLTRHPRLPVLYCLGTPGGADVLTVLSVSRESVSVMQSITLSDATFGAVVVQPVGAYAVLSHGATFNLYVYGVDPFTGALTLLSTTASNTGAAAMGFSHGGAYFYSRLSGSTVHQYSLAAGVLTATGTPFDPGTNTWIFVPSRDNRYLYSTTGGTNTARFLVADGAASNFSGAAFNMPLPLAGCVFSSESISQNGLFFFYTNSVGRVGTFAYNSADGALTEVFFQTGVSVGSPALSPDDRYFFTTTASTYEVYTVGSSGALSRKTGSPFSTGAPNMTALTFVPFLR